MFLIFALLGCGSTPDVPRGSTESEVSADDLDALLDRVETLETRLNTVDLQVDTVLSQPVLDWESHTIECHEGTGYVSLDVTPGWITYAGAKWIEYRHEWESFGTSNDLGSASPDGTTMSFDCGTHHTNEGNLVRLVFFYASSSS